MSIGLGDEGRRGLLAAFRHSFEMPGCERVLVVNGVVMAAKSQAVEPRLPKDSDRHSGHLMRLVGRSVVL